MLKKKINKIFRKDVTYDNIKGNKKACLTLFLKNTFFTKPLG